MTFLGLTSVEWYDLAGILLTLLGAGAVLALWRRRR